MKQHTVLIVEDNPLTLKVVRLTLGNEGYLVVEAATAVDALRLVETHSPDLILQDLLLPDMDGFELVTRLRKSVKTVGVPIIAFSGFLSRLEHGRAAAAGFSDFLPKPVEPSRLLQLVRGYLPEQIVPEEIGERRRLLVVDDDPVQLKLARVLLSGLGFQVVTATDGADALEKLRKEPVKAVLSDVLMPHVDGFRLCAEMRSDPSLRHIPVVLVSSNYVEEADRQVATRMGASAYVVRTPDLGGVIRALEGALGQPVSAATMAPPPSPGEHHQRVLLQLERHAAMNATYAHRSAMHASMLSVLAGVSEALIKTQGLEQALPDVLHSLLEASGVSHGAIYPVRPDGGELFLGAWAGYGEDAVARLRAFCGQSEFFEATAASLSPLLLNSSHPGASEILRLLDAECALLIPLVADQECLGLLLLASKTRDLTEQDWMPFARTMAVQIGQALALSRAFARLKASESRYKQLLQSAGDGIFLLDAELRITEANPAMERILQRPRESLLGVPLLDLVAPESRERAFANGEVLASSGEVRVADGKFLRADGQVATCDITGTRVEVEGAQMSIIIAHDVTEKMRAEGELRLLQTLTLGASEAPDLNSALQAVLRTIGEAIRLDYGGAWLPGPNGLECAEWWTPEAAVKDDFRPFSEPYFARGEGLLGRVWASAEPLWATCLSDLIPSRQQAGERAGLRGGVIVPVVVKEQVVAVLEFFYRQPCHERELLGLVSGAAAQIGPVISRQRAVEALRLSETRFARLSEAGIIGIFVADIYDTIHEANDSFLSLLGFSSEDLQSGEVRWSDLTPPEWRPLDEVAFRQLRSNGVAQPWEKEFFRKDKTRVPVIIGAAMLDHPYCIAFVSDLSQRKRVEAALGRSEEQLRQAQKMEAVGRLAGGVAHDFNNLLSIILSYSDLILEDLAPDTVIREDVEEILKAGKRGADLTRQLLMFSRQQVLVPEVIDINEVLLDMDKMLQRLLGADVTMVSLPAQGLAMVHMDRGSLEQIVLNLTVNARDAMPSGGRLTLETANVFLDQDYCRQHLGASSGPHVMLAVTDTGSGMDQATQARIFEPFFTTKSAGAGTGLGLSTVFGIVQGSGGSVWVYSEEGVGTVFKLYFPQLLTAEAAKSPTVEPLSAPLNLRGTETILLVEDEEPVRTVAASILRRSGYTVVEASNASEAWKISDDVSQAIDLLLTDVVMPGVSGPGLALRVNAQRPGLKTLFMSGYTDDTIFRHGVLEARMSYLQKPITPGSLNRKVREVLDA